MKKTFLIVALCLVGCTAKTLPPTPKELTLEEKWSKVARVHITGDTTKYDIVQSLGEPTHSNDFSIEYWPIKGVDEQEKPVEKMMLSILLSRGKCMFYEKNRPWKSTWDDRLHIVMEENFGVGPGGRRIDLKVPEK